MNLSEILNSLQQTKVSIENTKTKLIDMLDENGVSANTSLKINGLIDLLGDLASNSQGVGDLSLLETNDKSSIVAAINEMYASEVDVEDLRQELEENNLEIQESFRQQTAQALINAGISNVNKGDSLEKMLEELQSVRLDKGLPWMTLVPPSIIIGTNIPVKTYEACAECIGDKIYVAGGTSYYSLYEYDPNTNTWVDKGRTTANVYRSGSTVINSEMVIFGGYDSGVSGYGNPKVRAYNPQTNTWTEKANMITGRFNVNITQLDNKVYAIGGGVSSGALATNEVYDISTNTWSSKTSMTKERYSSFIGGLNGKISVIGGTLYSSSDGAMKVNECYDVALDSWTTKTVHPGSHGDVAWGSSIMYKDKFYLIGGQGNMQWYPYLRTYDIENDTYSDYIITLKGSSTDRSYYYQMATCSYKNFFYLFGGNDSHGYYDNVIIMVD